MTFWGETVRDGLVFGLERIRSVSVANSQQMNYGGKVGIRRVLGFRDVWGIEVLSLELPRN